MIKPIQIAQYQPVLDIVVQVVETLVREGEATIETSTHPKAIGLAGDVHKTLHAFHRNLPTQVTFSRQNKKYSRKYEGRIDGGRPLRLNLSFQEGLPFEEEPPADLFRTCVLDTEHKGRGKFP